MIKLWYTFLELPSWQGSALIAGVVSGLMVVAFLFFRAGYCIGVMEGSQGEDSE